ARPLAFLGLELAASGRSQLVALRAAALRGLLPAPLDEALLGQAVQGGEEGSRTDLEGTARDLGDAVGDGHAVARLEGERAQDQEVQGPLQELGTARRHRPSPCAIDVRYRGPTRTIAETLARGQLVPKRVAGRPLEAAD